MPSASRFRISFQTALALKAHRRAAYGELVKQCLDPAAHRASVDGRGEELAPVRRRAA